MYKFLLSLLLPTLLCARVTPSPPFAQPSVEYSPWITGPLLAPTPYNPELKHPGIFPFVVGFNFYAQYDENWSLDNTADIWSISPGFDYLMAFTKNAGVELIFSSVTNFQQGTSSTHLQDTAVLLGYQISNDQKNTWVPDCRLTFNTVFPTGNHDNLDPTLNGIDSSGQGAYFFGPTLSFRKLFYLPNHYFYLYWSLGYLAPLRAHIKGLSVYGGTPNTRGSITPGQTFIGFISGEYTFTQKWVFQFDTQYLFQFSSHGFKGTAGTNENGSKASVGLPSSFQLGATVGLEYNFSADAGILFGSWFTIAGYNAKAFTSAYFGYVYIF